MKAKEYRVIQFDSYRDGWQEDLQRLLNQMGKQGWSLKTFFYDPSKVFAHAIFESDK